MPKRLPTLTACHSMLSINYWTREREREGWEHRYSSISLSLCELFILIVTRTHNTIIINASDIVLKFDDICFLSFGPYLRHKCEHTSTLCFYIHLHSYSHSHTSIHLVTCPWTWSLRCSAVTAMSKLKNRKIHHSLHGIGFCCCCCLYASLSFVFITAQCKWRMINLVEKLHI